MASTIRAKKRRSGFTLIEVLAAVVILLLIVLAMGRIFAATTKAYRNTNKQVERDASARAVMDFIVREISEAMFDAAFNNTNAALSMRYRADTCKDNFGVEGADEIWFVSANNRLRSDKPREGVQTVFFVQNYENLTNAPPNARFRFGLWRSTRYPTSPYPWQSAYDKTQGLKWSGDSEGSSAQKQRNDLLLENVRTFEIFAYTNPEGTGERTYNWDSTGTSRYGAQDLFCMDIYLETLSEADAILAAQMAASLGPNEKRTVEFVESSVRRYYQRIYFPNKRGYFDDNYP
ncbi:MAG: prepilin-type N-terminal cleavage/methylation domain-containing protein [Kiritimatiellae bacterium]|nr:prepilin-type N-terminal cleavage/methylation domain-containing protein [Kiritimatiellia bacterium]